MGRAESLPTISVTVVYSPSASRVDEVAITLAAGATVADALQASGLAQRHSQLDLAAVRIGVWGKLKQGADTLRERDRVEVYRPLTVDPKEARRVRYRQHRERYGAK